MKVGILGGTGLYDIDGIHNLQEQKLETPFGDPSDAYMCGTLEGHEVVFLPRHGRGHRLMPSEINHPANIYGMKMLGVERVISVSAVGSLREEYRPRDIVLIDQYFDRTKESAKHSFFGAGIVAHVSFAYPTCADLASRIAAAGKSVIAASSESPDVRLATGGTYVNMQGPAFSTLAESNFHRHFGYDVIGMTSLAEAKLCREAELCYQPMCMVTDYDCWHATEEHVTVEMVIEHLHANAALAKAIVKEVILNPGDGPNCDCANALATAILTQPHAMPSETKQKLSAIIGKYVE